MKKKGEEGLPAQARIGLLRAGPASTPGLRPLGKEGLFRKIVLDSQVRPTISYLYANFLLIYKSKLYNII